MPSLARRLRQGLVVSLLAILAMDVVSRAFGSPGAGEEDARRTKEEERLKKLDSGPSVIDVASYPAPQQEAYRLFAKKCSTCHGVARAINSDYAVLPAEWERYVRRMMVKPNSGITSDEGKQLFRFLVYDSSTRKPDVVGNRLAGLAAEERAAAIEKIKSINPSFKP